MMSRIFLVLFVLLTQHNSDAMVLRSYEISGKVVGYDPNTVEIRSGSILYRVPKSIIFADPKVGSEVTFHWSERPNVKMVRIQSRVVASAKPNSKSELKPAESTPDTKSTKLQSNVEQNSFIAK